MKKLTPARSLATLIFCASVTAFASAQVADAKQQSKGPAASAAVRTDGDAGLTGETPLDTQGVSIPTDISLEGSPLRATRPGAWIKAETPIRIKLSRAVTSGTVKNGDTVVGVLVDPVKTGNGSLLAPGTPIKATILTAAAAGKVQSAGVLSLQVYQVGGLQVISNVLEFAGQEGHREVADANPDQGTEAVVQAGTPLSFRALGSGDKPDPNEPPETGPGSGRAAGSVRAGQSSVGPPSGFARQAPGSAPTTEIHGTTTPH